MNELPGGVDTAQPAMLPRFTLLTLLALVCSSASAADPLPGHSVHGEAFNEGPRQAAVLIPGTGKVEFKISTRNAEAQKFFNQGVGQLHGFWYYEAERSFRQVALLDKNCAMAYWGMAMANVNNDKRARQFVTKATALKEKADAREKLWIATLETYYKDDKREKKQRELDFIGGLETLVQDYPEDVEAKAFLAWKIWHAKGDAPFSSPQAVDAVLDQVFAANPEHPAHHYRIHLWDGSKPKRALKSAASNGQAAPGIAHMWHMPGHTYSKLGRHDDAAWQQEASTRVDHAYMTANWILPDQIHNYAHNEEWLVRTFNELGRARDAEGLARSLIANPRHPKYNKLGKGSARYGIERLLETLEKWEHWPEIVQVTQSAWISSLAEDDSLEVVRLKSRALAFYHLQDLGALEACMTALSELNRAAVIRDREAKAKKEKEAAQAAAKKPETKTEPGKGGAVAAATPAKPNEKVAKKGEPSSTPQGKPAAKDKPFEGPAEDALKSLAAYRAVLLGRRDAGAMIEAAKKLSKVQAAYLWLKIKQPAKAEALVKDFPADLGGRLAKVEVLAVLKKTDQVKKALEEAGKLAFAMDADLPVVRRLDAMAGNLGHAKWRAAAPVRKDSGVRPALSTLGPVHWQAPVAPEWKALTLDGKKMDSASLHGRPHVLLFYLGSACGHCMEQIKTFAQSAPDYKKAGIELAAITLEPMSLAGRITEQMKDGKLPPFPIYCDPGLEMFKTFKAYDDFEQEPLHAAVFIDAQGRARWWDVSWEPFTDASFLLKEAVRLSKLPAVGAKTLAGD